MIRTIRQSIAMLALLTVLTGIVYPLIVTGIAQVFFPHAANGSIIERDGKPVGSALIGQPFSDPTLFLEPSVGDGAVRRTTRQRRPDRISDRPIRRWPMRSSNASTRCARPIRQRGAGADRSGHCVGSGLDPHISPAAAEYQVARVARARGLSLEAGAGASRAPPRSGSSASSANHASTCSC